MTDGPALAGWVYRASLYLSTPLAVLRHHGDTAPAESIRMEHGVGGQWVPVFADVARAGDTVHSLAGHVPEHGGDVLPWLIDYRAIIEDEMRSVRDRVEAVRELVDSPWCARWRRALPQDIATAWVASRLSQVLGVSIGATVPLVQAGYLDLPCLAAATDQALASVPGIGPKTLAVIRRVAGRSVT